MHIAALDDAPTCTDRDLYESRLTLDGARIIELGCGAAVHTRAIAGGGPDRRVIAFEVDRVQHHRNLAITDLPNVEFRYGGAEKIDGEESGCDVVFMFKSLHHVPLAALDAALREINRVLKPGGYAYLSEPVFAGAFNDIIRLFHDEQRVREAAFAAITRAVDAGLFELAEETFFLAPSRYQDFDEFEQRIINATHTEHRLDDLTYRRVRELFEQHSSANGAEFAVPMRLDLLRKPV